jgi:hypothetical protein
LSAVQGGLLLAKTSRSEEPLKVALDMAFDHVASHSRSLSRSSPSRVAGSAKKKTPLTKSGIGAPRLEVFPKVRAHRYGICRLVDADCCRRAGHD